ncbi:MAG: FecR domain-containing protein [Candidatus Omnitrophota bacterium]
MKSKICLFTLILLIGLLSVAFAAEDSRCAIIVKIDGSAEVRTAAKQWVRAKVNMKLVQGDIIRTNEKSVVLLQLDSEQTAVVEIKENSKLKLAELQSTKEGDVVTLLDLSMGDILIEAKKLQTTKSKFEVKTPTSIVAVRGTKFEVSVKAIE